MFVQPLISCSGLLNRLIRTRFAFLIQKSQKGRFVTPTAIRTFIAGIRSNIERLRKEEIDEKKVLFLGVDLEQSFLESKYAEIVKTSDTEFQSLMREINADTMFHREYLNRKLIEWTC
jgi:hypothetical protein